MGIRRVALSWLPDGGGRRKCRPFQIHEIGEGFVDEPVRSFELCIVCRAGIHFSSHPDDDFAPKKDEAAPNLPREEVVRRGGGGY